MVIVSHLEECRMIILNLCTTAYLGVWKIISFPKHCIIYIKIIYIGKHIIYATDLLQDVRCEHWDTKGVIWWWFQVVFHPVSQNLLFFPSHILSASPHILLHVPCGLSTTCNNPHLFQVPLWCHTISSLSHPLNFLLGRRWCFGTAAEGVVAPA